jgi:hypothetical protein
MANTPDDYARAIIAEGQRRGITPRGIEIALATVEVESAFIMYANESDPPSEMFFHQAQSTDADSDGLFQQRPEWWGTAAQRMDATGSAGLFYDHLVKYDYNSTAFSPGTFAQDVQGSAYPDRYDQHWDQAVALYTRLTSGETAVTDRPDFNEYPNWCPNNEGRNGTKVDLWLIHTEESSGTDNADGLAKFLISTASTGNPVSYHYTISQAADGGVTVVDCVDTDDACWAVGNSNARSISLCFAGSSVSWSRDQWLLQAKAIDVAAYLCVQDCNKYGIAKSVIAPPYPSDPPGISDHRYCTEHLKDGNTHTDVGDNFPWDVFAAAVAKYANPAVTPPVVVTPPPVVAPPAVTPPPVTPTAFTYPSTDDMVQQIWVQLFGPDGNGWEFFGKHPIYDRYRYTVEVIADIQSKVGAA